MSQSHNFPMLLLVFCTTELVQNTNDNMGKSASCRLAEPGIFPGFLLLLIFCAEHTHMRTRAPTHTHTRTHIYIHIHTNTTHTHEVKYKSYAGNFWLCVGAAPAPEAASIGRVPKYHQKLSCRATNQSNKPNRARAHTCAPDKRPLSSTPAKWRDGWWWCEI